MIIGLSGYARSGKDTAAQALVEDGWIRIAFADKVREFLYRLDPIVDTYSQYRLQDVIDQYGWSGYKESGYSDEIRGLLQRLGTECGRGVISDTIWVDAALGGSCTCNGEQANVCHDIRNEPHIVGCPRWGMPKNIVVTDVRFPNEVKAIKDRGGMVIRISREGVGPANNHPSETALDDYKFDAIITNTTVEKLHRKIRAFGTLGQPRI